MMLWANSSTVNVLATQGRIQGPKGFSYLLGLTLFCNLEVNEAASRGGTHLALGLLNEKRLAGPHEGGTRLDGDGLDVASNEGVVSGSGDDGRVHIQMVLGG